MQKRVSRAQNNILDDLGPFMGLFPAEEEKIGKRLDLGPWRVARRCWSLWFVWPGLPGRPRVQEKRALGL